MQMKLTDHVLRLAQTAPRAAQRRAVYEAVIREGKASAGVAALSRAVPAGIQVRKGKVSLPAMALEVRFTASPETHPGPGNRPEDMASKQPAGLLAGISPKDIEALRRAEPDLLKWIAAKKTNAARFFADPLGSLDLAGVKLDRRLRLRITQVRKRSMALRAKVPPVRIESIKVGA